MKLDHALYALKAMTKRELTKFLQQKGRLISAFVRPALWLFVFAVGFRGVYGVDAGEPYLQRSVNYEYYILPGLTCMVLLFSGMQSSLAMGDLGADLVLDLVDPRPLRVMTICNTGGLATVERGTALAVIQTLHERGVLQEALPLETRPLLQGGRLTTWELQRMGAPHRLIVDSAGPFLLARGQADVVLIGADRVAANGDTANKVGSFSLALGAAHANVPFIVVAPESTVDAGTENGAAIEIEDRGPQEVVSVLGTPIAPPATAAINPAFDVTPVSLITALVTELRVVRFDRLGPVAL